MVAINKKACITNRTKRVLVYKNKFPTNQREPTYIWKLKRRMMRGGNYQTISNIVTKALILIKEQIPQAQSEGSINFLVKAMTVLEPKFFLRTTRKSGRKFFIPCPCRSERRIFYAVKFFVESVRVLAKRDGIGNSVAIMRECINILIRKDSDAIRKKVGFIQNVFKYKPARRFLRNV